MLFLEMTVRLEDVLRMELASVKPQRVLKARGHPGKILKQGCDDK